MVVHGHPLPGRFCGRVLLLHGTRLPGLRGGLQPAVEPGVQPGNLSGSQHGWSLCPGLSHWRHHRRQARTEGGHSDGGGVPAPQLFHCRGVHARIECECECSNETYQDHSVLGGQSNHRAAKIVWHWRRRCDYRLVANRVPDLFFPFPGTRCTRRPVHQLHQRALRVDPGTIGSGPGHGGTHAGNRSTAAGSTSRIANVHQSRIAGVRARIVGRRAGIDAISLCAIDCRHFVWLCCDSGIASLAGKFGSPG
mmetsp:Transcript_15643/g.33833  ORF Transcript_15643/g.33833 Transcript_15643/m.33833 type:complete len:251 (+) Transcript_15643:1223-1975(+)